MWGGELVMKCGDSVESAVSVRFLCTLCVNSTHNVTVNQPLCVS